MQFSILMVFGAYFAFHGIVSIRTVGCNMYAGAEGERVVCQLPASEAELAIASVDRGPGGVGQQAGCRGRGGVPQEV